MKLFFRYIAIVAAVFASATGCSLVEFGPDPIPGENTDVVTVIGRITRFDERDVLTRGIKDGDEGKLTSMAMAIFKVNETGDGLDGGCVYYQYAANQAELLFTIDRGSNFDYDARYAMYIFANMPGMDRFTVKDEANNVSGTTLEEMMNAFYNVEGIDIPQNGFPMMGSLGDTFSTKFDKDGKEFVLSPIENGNLTTPKVNGVAQTLLTIPMKAMFAKINFTIEVRPDQTIEGNYSPQFAIDGYTVNNVPSKVDFNSATNSDTGVSNESYNLPITGNTVASGANRIEFSFYLPERLLTPTTAWDKYSYPFGAGSDIRTEDLIYRQRYKSKLLGDDKKATNVVISGRFRDHQSHWWNIDYTIYLGEDNFGDFNIKRNCEYNNIMTIRGVQTSSDMSEGENYVAIDHRVNIERTQPAIIALRREVLLDSHFEVRPLRVRKSSVEDNSINAVKVEVMNPTTTNWMRLERSFGDGTPEGSPQTTVGGEPTSIYIDDDPSSASYGKRKFFTYNLIDGNNANATDASLKESTSVILPLSDVTECCWIYVDECTEEGDDVRSGVIKVSYGSLDGTTFTPANNASYPEVNYVICQRKLFPVEKDGREYNIEYFEEYLYNFDSEDDFRQTEYEGMKWGLEGVQLSYDHEALYFKSHTGEWANGIVDYFTGDVPAYYDFYVKKHDEARMADPKQVTLHEYAGYDFCSEIIQTVNGGQKDAENNAYDNNPNNDINILQLNEEPKSAIEYCYNKNKRNNKGQVVWQKANGVYDQSQLNWFLPAVDEVEDIVMSTYGSGLNTYSRFFEFQNQDYWSCQPAFIQNYAHMQWTLIFWPIHYYGTFYFDDVGDTTFDKNNQTDRANVGSARSTRVTYENGVYSSISSGTNGYYSYYDASASTDKYKYSGTYNGVEIGSIVREAGNHPRNVKNRVRCVRKQ